ncbi:Gap-Pol polyprotein-like protein [Reticulomyxa filosa]|uniref:Gap-Pol polyprotein-like protein n=1 Tax=Reticulomyxa filosa TaxID=46433 RepID=X6PCW4_RETFI|nr:Gap-Pol polyprotein-like protein [Reticulomyxa filosa]|eukprot:ETO35933.1 Gap-Pol polyprotein-like protein [Reticulomyxa filosa]
MLEHEKFDHVQSDEILEGQDLESIASSESIDDNDANIVKDKEKRNNEQSTPALEPHSDAEELQEKMKCNNVDLGTIIQSTSVESNANIDNNIEPQIKKLLQQLISKNQRLASKNSFDIGQIPNAEMKLKLKPGTKPIKHKPYPLNNMYQEEVKRQVNELKNIGARYVDHRKLNQATIRDEWPLPNINDIVKKLASKQVFSKLDLRSDICIMGFGFTNAPSTFQRIMASIFSDLEDVDVYIDDILLATDTNEKHLQILSDIFRHFDKYNLRLAMEKCEFFQKEIIFLGHVISSNGVLNVPKPKNKETIGTIVGIDTMDREIHSEYCCINNRID